MPLECSPGGALTDGQNDGGILLIAGGKHNIPRDSWKPSYGFAGPRMAEFFLTLRLVTVY